MTETISHTAIWTLSFLRDLSFVLRHRAPLASLSRKTSLALSILHLFRRFPIRQSQLIELDLLLKLVR
jgi:hypothetical protein